MAKSSATKAVREALTVATGGILDGPSEAGGLWIATAELAELAGINERNARDAAFRCMNGFTWRGANLAIRAVKSNGGQGGKALQVHVPSLPENLRALYLKQHPGLIEIPTAPAVALPAPARIDSGLGARIAERNWKLAIIAPALKWPKRSHERAAVIADIAAREHPGPNGDPVQFAADTLRGWLAKIEDDGGATLARPRRKDAGARRTVICRAWDSACPLPDTARRKIADEIETYIRSLWRSYSSERKINSLASTKLKDLSAAAGWADAPLIKPGLHLVRRHSEMRLVNIRDNDAKKFFDLYTPRIHRSREDLQPGDIVIGDVHPLDFQVAGPTGELIYPRMIAWLDLATNDLFYTLVPKRGVTQADVARSFVDMVQVFGLPRTLYLDNGSEYKWREMEQGFAELQGLVESWTAFRAILNSAEIIDAATGMSDTHEADRPPRPVVRAKPYNAPAKAIEGMFSALAKFFSAVPGYVGGDRMRKKTQNVGKAPQPFPGTWEQFEAAIAEVIAFYRNEEQRGTMADKSPNNRKREAIAAGWGPVMPQREVFLYAFASVERVRVHNGGIQIAGAWFDHDALLAVRGAMIEVRHAKWDGEHALWIDSRGAPIIIHKVKMFHPMDTAGAIEQSRMAGLQKRYVRQIAATAPKLDTVAEAARHNATLAPPPETPEGADIKLTGEAGRAVKAIRDGANGSGRIEKLPPQAIKHPKTGQVLLPRAPETQRPAARRYDIFNLPPPERKKPDASADAPGFDIYKQLAKRPPP